MREVFEETFQDLGTSLEQENVRLVKCEPNYSRAARYFYSEKMRRVWTFGSMYLGMSPYRAPGTYSLLQYIETVDGIWYPAGGFQRVCYRMNSILSIHRLANKKNRS